MLPLTCAALGPQVTIGKAKPIYCYDNAELKSALTGVAPGSYVLQRFKVQCDACIHTTLDGWIRHSCLALADMRECKGIH